MKRLNVNNNDRNIIRKKTKDQDDKDMIQGSVLLLVIVVGLTTYAAIDTANNNPEAGKLQFGVLSLAILLFVFILSIRYTIPRMLKNLMVLLSKPGQLSRFDLSLALVFLSLLIAISSSFFLVDWSNTEQIGFRVSIVLGLSLIKLVKDAVMNRSRR